MVWPDRFTPQSLVLRSPTDMSAGACFPSNRTGSVPVGHVDYGRSGTGPERPLGKTAKSVDQNSKDEVARDRRATAFRLQRTAASLLPDERVGLCKWAVVSKAKGVDVHLTSYEGGAVRASFAGLQTCGSVWHCPCCGQRISETRRGELNDLLAWAREAGLKPVMVTLTARHGVRDDLWAQLDAMKRAKQRLRQRREWRRINHQIAGTVTATELTHGANGWHTHFHEILLIEAPSEAEALDLLAGLGRVWRACLLGVGLSGGRAAWQAQGAAAAGRYVGKWGAAEELALGGAKAGRGKGRTPMQLLSAAQAGDEEAADLWRTYARVFKGRRQLVWSPGLKDRAGIQETTDAAAAENESQDDAEEVKPILNIEHRDWTGRPGRLGARHRRARLLDAAETGGAGAARLVVDAGGEDCPPLESVELIEPVKHERWKPRPGGLAAAAMAAVRRVSDTGDPHDRVSGDQRSGAGAGDLPARRSRSGVPRGAQGPA